MKLTEENADYEDSRPLALAASQEASTGIPADEVILNRNEVIFEDYGNINFSNIEPISVKNCNLQSYLDHAKNYYIKNFFTENTKYFEDTNIIVDVKYHDLDAGKYPCIPGWHTDGSLFVSKKIPKPEKYLLYLTGDISMTEFCNDEIIMPRIKESLDKMKFYEAKSIFTLTSGKFALYDSTNMHRGTKSATNGKRLLLRMMTSDKIKGRSYNESIFIPYSM